MRKMRTVTILAAALLLASCQTEAEQKAEFMEFCTTKDFTANQCEVLYRLDKSSREANDSASAAAGFAAGAAGAAMGSRR